MVLHIRNDFLGSLSSHRFSKHQYEIVGDQYTDIAHPYINLIIKISLVVALIWISDEIFEYMFIRYSSGIMTLFEMKQSL
jgi:K+-transporting ATPase A subunit